MKKKGINLQNRREFLKSASAGLASISPIGNIVNRSNPRIGTRNLQKLLVINDNNFRLDPSFQSSGPTSLPDGDTALNLRYSDRPRAESETFMGEEAERIYELVDGMGLGDKLNVYGNNVASESGNGNYTPYVAIVGDFKPGDYR